MAASLAKELQSIVEHDVGMERFDLAGWSQTQINDLVAAAFKSHEWPSALRFSFVVGGGRLVRQRYDADLPKWLSAALREAGFEDDRGAALGSTRAFKFQEDLSLNLHLMHVFPGVAPRASASAAASVTPAESATPAGPTPAQRLVSCSLKELQAMTPSRLMTWSEKRAGAALLGDAVARIDALEGKMATRCALTPAETEEYAALSREALEEKARWLAAEGKAQVAAALLTGEEFRVILEEMGERLAGLRTEAGAGGGSSKAALAAAAKAAELEAKREALKAASANPLLPPLRGEAEARALRSKLAALDRLEKAKAGTLLTLAEARELGARGDHAARLAAILADARGWFESDAAWDIRLKAFMAAPIGKGGPGGGKGKGR